MKKALQIQHLRAPRTIPKRSVVRGLFGAPREACRGRPRDERAQLLVVDLGGPTSRSCDLFKGSRRRPPRGRLWWFRARFRQRPRDEFQRRSAWQPRADLAGAMTEF